MNPETEGPPTLRRLWDQARAILREVKDGAVVGTTPSEVRKIARVAESGEPDSLFDSIGLNLTSPLATRGYSSTPENTLAFAETGGDGVHFGFILADGRLTEDVPIVMTIPTIGYPDNIILGANLREFLGLGMYRGYFILEQLGYRPEEFVDVYASREPWPDGTDFAFDAWERWLMERLTRAMDLRPWDDVRSRLNRLQREFSPLLFWSDREPADNALTF